MYCLIEVKESNYAILCIKVLLLMFAINCVMGAHCPHYCRCHVSNHVHHVQCIGKGLISVDLDVPRTVQWLQLSDNSIYELKDYIFENLGLSNIVELNLDKNAIQSIGLDAFSGLTKLKAIDLSNNHLYSIPPLVFEKIPSLIFVFLSGNPLRYLQRNQPFLRSLSVQVLDISNCRISFIPEFALSSLPSLAKLNISSNHIESLDHCSFEDLRSLEEIDLSNNMIVCDSKIEEFISWTSSKLITIFGSFCKKSSTLSPLIKKTMEKMIMLNSEDLVPDLEDEAANSKNGCSCSICSSNEEELKKNTITKIITVQEKNKNDYTSLFLILTFISGFVLGIALTISFWICYRVFLSNRRHRLCYTSMIHDYPPPSYNEVFFN